MDLPTVAKRATVLDSRRFSPGEVAIRDCIRNAQMNRVVRSTTAVSMYFMLLHDNERRVRRRDDENDGDVSWGITLNISVKKQNSQQFS